MEPKSVGVIGGGAWGTALAQALIRVMLEIGHCADCRTFTE